MDRKGSRKRLAEIVKILRKYNVLSGMTPEKLRMLLEELGPTFIKFGQVLSMQSEILPHEYCEELGKLKSNVAPMDFDIVKSILEEEYGEPVDEIFSSIGHQPLGSASIAQVHLATLIGGDEVVVKVQRPGIYDTMYRDIQLLKNAAGVIKFAAHIGDEIDIHMLMDELWVVAKQEMDFTIEAENAQKFYKNNESVAYSTCPKIFAEFSTSKVLMMEYIKGIEIGQVEVLKEKGYDVEEIAEKLAHNFIKQVMEDGFYHADPHSGNILIRDSQIVWIDLGMMGHFSSRDKRLFTDAISAIAESDIHKLTDFVLTVGEYSGDIDYNALSADVEKMLNRYGAVSFEGMDMVKMTNDFLSILKAHKMRIPKGLSMLGRAMATIQGTLMALHPEINFSGIMIDYASSSFLKNLNVKKEVTSILKTVYTSFRNSLSLPTQISNALRMLSKGISKVNLELSMSSNMKSYVGDTVNKLIVTMIMCSLLLGSSVIITTNMRPQISGVPALGVFGYFVALILGAWLIHKVIRKK